MPRVIIVAMVLGAILFVIIKLMIITCCIKQRKENKRREEKKLGIHRKKSFFVFQAILACECKKNIKIPLFFIFFTFQEATFDLERKENVLILMF